MWTTALSALLSHWKRNPIQAATLFVGLALATSLWTGVQAINAEARASYDRAAAVLEQNALPVLLREDGGAVPLSDYVALRRAGWEVAPVIEGEKRLGGRQVTLLGLDPLSAPVLPARAGSDGAEEETEGAAFAAFITPPGQLFAAQATIDRLAGTQALPELVPSRDLAPGLLVGDIGIVAGLLGRRGDPDRLTLLPDQREGLPPIREIAPGLIETGPPAGADISGLTGSFHLNLTAFGLLSFAVGLFIVHGAVGLAVEQRRPLVRTLRTLGLPLRALAALLVAELLAIALLAGLAGIGLGYLVASALLPDVAATLRGLYGAPASGSLTLRPEWVLSGLGIALAGTAIAAGQSVWTLMHLPLLAPAQPRAWHLASLQGLRRQALAALALMAAAGLIAALGQGLLAGFVTLGALLLGAALLLPPVLAALIGALSRRAATPVAEWFWGDSRQQLPALSLALMALLLALATNIGVSTMVGSFRAAFTVWLDQRLAAELYLDAGPAAPPGLASWLATHTDAALPQARIEARLEDAPGTLHMLVDHPTYRENWPLLSAAPGVWDRLAAGDGALVNEQMALRHNLSPGDTARIDGEAMTVLGIYPDYGNPRPEARLGESAFVARYGPADGTRFALRVAPGEAAALRDALGARFGLRDDQITDQAAVKAASLEIFERTFAVTAALNVLTLGVAGVAILTSLMTLARLRLPQLAPLWALGLTRAGLARMELLRSAALAGFTAMLAVPTGLAVAWLLLAVVNVEAFGWRLPMRIFPADWALLGGLGILAALAAAALPARRLARRPPADLLRVFASER